MKELEYLKHWLEENFPYMKYNIRPIQRRFTAEYKNYQNNILYFGSFSDTVQVHTPFDADSELYLFYQSPKPFLFSHLHANTNVEATFIGYEITFETLLIQHQVIQPHITILDYTGKDFLWTDVLGVAIGESVHLEYSDDLGVSWGDGGYYPFAYPLPIGYWYSVVGYPTLIRLTSAGGLVSNSYQLPNRQQYILIQDYSGGNITFVKDGVYTDVFSIYGLNKNTDVYDLLGTSNAFGFSVVMALAVSTDYSALKIINGTTVSNIYQLPLAGAPVLNSYYYQSFWMSDDDFHNPQVNSWVDYKDINGDTQRFLLGSLDLGCQLIEAVSIVAINGCHACTP